MFQCKLYAFVHRLVGFNMLCACKCVCTCVCVSECVGLGLVCFVLCNFVSGLISCFFGGEVLV